MRNLLLVALVLFSFYSTVNGQRVIRVGVYDNYPLAFSDSRGEPKGLFIDILKDIAEKEGWRLIYKNGKADECFQWLESGEIDVTTESGDYKGRSANFDIASSGLVSTWARVYAKRESDYTSLLDLGGKRVAVLENSYFINGPYKGFYASIKELDLRCTIVKAKNYKEILELIDKKKVDAGIVSRIYGDINDYKYDVMQTPVVFSPFRLSFIFRDAAPLEAKVVPIIESHIVALKQDKSSIYYRSMNTYFKEHKPFEVPIWGYVILGVAIFIVGQLLLYVNVLRRMVAARTADLKRAYANIKSRQQTLSLIYNNASEFIALFQVRKLGSYAVAKLPDWYLKELYMLNKDYPSYKVIGMGLKDLYRKLLKLDDNEINYRYQKMAEAIRSQQQIKYEEGFKMPDGSRGVAESSLIPILDRSKRCTHILYVSRNVTEERKMVEALSESEKRLQMAIEGAREGMWDWDIRTGSLHFNDYQFKMLGYEVDKSQPKPKEFYEMLHPDDRRRTRERLVSHLKGETDYYENEYRIKTQSGEWKWLLVHGRVVDRDSNGRAIRAIGTHVDIHESKVTEQALMESQQTLANLMANIPGMVYRSKVDEGFTPVFVSEGSKVVFGIPPEHFLNGKIRLSDMIPEEYNVENVKAIQQALAANKQFQIIYPVNIHGEKKWMWEQGRAISPAGDMIEGFVMDITDRRLAQEKIISTIIETEDNERARIAKELHDTLGQKLTTVSLNFNSLKKDISFNNGGLKKLNTGLNYLKEAIRDSREIAHNLMPQSIEDFGYVLSVQSLLADLDAVSETKFDFYDNLKGDRLPKNTELHLYRITQEAVNNILKYAKATTVSIQLMKYEEEVILTIEDDGIGFDANEKMETGNSFGLKSMLNRVNSLSGSLQIESGKGNGTVIIVEVPYRKESYEGKNINS
ncbi:PAS domain-containing protein [Fulvivirga sp. 29W222]|uniref:histidine kinase n=1 Tax=Fulvivirga marina TaxID=2494733 RepID=A0A937FUC7_9BACT|nr:PAS domain-containing protein [Fulvivirga marina]MBL6445057.1 PAS domain-containing protein [Fulvivirga marina]